VLVAAQHAAHRFGRTAAEPVRELEPVDEAGVEEHVSFGRGERRFGERLHMWFLPSGRAMTVPGGTDARPVLGRTGRGRGGRDRDAGAACTVTAPRSDRLRVRIVVLVLGPSAPDVFVLDHPYLALAVLVLAGPSAAAGGADHAAGGAHAAATGGCGAAGHPAAPAAADAADPAAASASRSAGA